MARVDGDENQSAQYRSTYRQLDGNFTGVIIVMVAVVAVTIANIFNSGAGNGNANTMAALVVYLVGLTAAVIIDRLPRYIQQ